MCPARVPIPLSEKHQSTRLDADQQRLINMYPHSRRGYRQFPGLDRAATVGTAYQDDTLSVTEASWGQSQLTNSRSLLAVVNRTNDRIDIWTLSAPPSLATAGSVQSFDVSSQTSDPRGFFVLSSGRFFVTGGSTIYQYTMSSYDIPNASYDSGNDIDLSGQLTEIVALDVKASKAYVLASDGIIYQYDVTGVSPLTLSYDTKTLDVGGGVGLTVDNDEDTILVHYDTSAANQFSRYELGTAEDVTTATLYAKSTLAPIQSTTPKTACFDDSFFTTLILYDNSLNGDQFERWLVQSDLTVGGGGFRGAEVMAGVPYVVQGEGLYTFAEVGGVPTSLGFIDGNATGSGTDFQRCVIDTDGTQLVITTGDKSYVYTTSGGVVEITDGDLDAADSSAHLDSRFYFDQPSGQFSASALNDATAFDASDFASAESFGDDIVRVLAVDQLLYLFGERSIEIWYSSGVGRPPVERQEVIDEVGIIGRYAVTVIDNVIYWIDDQRRLSRMKQLQFESVYTPALGREWAGYSTANDVYLTSFTFDNENFVEMVFPAEGVSWVYHENSGEVFSRQYNGGQTRTGQHLFVYKDTHVIDRVNGAVYQLDGSQYFDDDDNPNSSAETSITRTLDTGLITPELFERPDSEMIINGFHLTLECSGAGTVSVSLSKDNGAFGTARDLSVTSGTKRYELRRWGKMREAIFRITTTSNIKVDVVDASIDVTLLND